MEVMNNMKVIDLLNKIANGEDVPKKIRIDHWCYKFEWEDYADNYIDKHEDKDLMSVLSCDREELNYEVHEIKEEKKIPEKLEAYCLDEKGEYPISPTIYEGILKNKINEIIDYLEYLKSKGEW